MHRASCKPVREKSAANFPCAPASGRRLPASTKPLKRQFPVPRTANPRPSFARNPGSSSGGAGRTPLWRRQGGESLRPSASEVYASCLSFAATARGGAPTFFRKESRQRFARGYAPLTPVSVLPRSYAPPSPEARPACGDCAPPNAGHLTGTGLQSSIAKVPCALGLRLEGSSDKAPRPLSLHTPAKRLPVGAKLLKRQFPVPRTAN